ncbi:hypothetical protein [Tessaracoccus sp.]|uniref:hypothetical protein n=1 Tax=Tessaracoccus sp. TaxID=1971211 RepID=UPI0026217F9E|nr:hypothetical protein [Tessaracoccus sp.]
MRKHILREVQRTGVEEVLERGRALLVRRLQPDHGRVRILGAVHQRAVGSGLLRVDSLDIEAQPPLQREQRSAARVVGKERDRGTLGCVSRGAELGVARDLSGGVLVHKRVVEEAERELLTKQAPGRDVEALLGDPA